ncbi:CU044_5270 family protein [Micromonospora sp. NPDC047730]|uniref:CU044_5270 family protein n=1 Tax=Micromonospora sp. NPDC047730 TaxID=3364253 RepID=UPI00371ADD42
MHTKQQVRELLHPADPARDAVVPPSPLTAHDLILRAEDATATPAGPVRRAAPRRTVLVGAAAAVAALGSAGLAQALRDGPVPALPTSPQPVDGVVLQPVSYEVTATEPAGRHLRALAARIVDAPHEGAAGPYSYHHTKSWGSPTVFSPEGHRMSYVQERREWVADDGRRWQDTKSLGVEFPDAASREYWSTRPQSPSANPSATRRPPGIAEIPPDPVARRLPADRAELARWLRIDQSAGDVAMRTYHLYSSYLVPRRTRADLLTILAENPGFVWRGRVVDRAGRQGVAVTADLVPPAGQGLIVERAQMLLVFDPSTGELLAHEYLETAPKRRVLHYALLLKARRTDTVN